jgi:hypothetical protein
MSYRIYKYAFFTYYRLFVNPHKKTMLLSGILRNLKILRKIAKINFTVSHGYFALYLSRFPVPMILRTGDRTPSSFTLTASLKKLEEIL